MNEDNYNKPPSASTICLIAFSTFIITIIVYFFISNGAVEPEIERKPPDKISFSTTSTTESAKTTSAETYYNGWDDDTPKLTDNNGIYYPENHYNIGNDIPKGYYILVYNGNIDTYGDANFKIYSTPDGNDFSGSFQNSAFIKLEGHGYIAMTFCDAYPLETFSGENNPFEKSGMFRVGVDVDEGTYRIVPLYDSLPTLWTVHKDIDSIDYDLCFTDYHEDDNMEVTLHEGEILQTQFCVIEKTS